MLSEERMTIDERRKYLKVMERRYHRANRLIRLLHAESLARRPCPHIRPRRPKKRDGQLLADHSFFDVAIIRLQ